VTVAVTSYETGGIADAEYFFARISDEYNLAREHKDELIRRCVPVPLTGPAAWRHSEVIDPKLGKTCGVAELSSFAFAAWEIIWCRV
jgi:hypothetical protein